MGYKQQQNPQLSNPALLVCVHIHEHKGILEVERHLISYYPIPRTASKKESIAYNYAMQAIYFHCFGENLGNKS